jgi:hypothetical protein
MTRNRTRTILQALFLGALSLAFSLTEARAGFTVSLASTTASAGNLQFNYSASIAGSEQIVAGNFFQFFDFSGLVPGSATAPAGWTATTPNYDMNPLPSVILSHADDPAVPNLVFTYNGSTPITGPVTLTGFSATSVFGSGGTLKNFTGHNTQSNGTFVDVVGDVNVPSLGLPSPSPAPEPSSLVLGGIGAAFFGLTYARRRAARMR